MFNEAPVRTPSARATPAADPETTAIAAIIERRRTALYGEDERRERRADGHVDGLMSEVARHFGNTAARKAELEGEIAALIADRKTGRWLPGFTADLMLVHGENPAIYEAVSALVQQLRDLRQVERRYGQKCGPRGAWLNKRIHALCDAHGIMTPQKKRLARQLATNHAEKPR